VLLFLFASHSVSTLLLTPLEGRYPPLFIQPGAAPSGELKDVKFIVNLERDSLLTFHTPARKKSHKNSA
jgi:hypothetical protein